LMTLADSWQFHLAPAAGVLGAALVLYFVFSLVPASSPARPEGERSPDRAEVVALLGFLAIPVFFFLCAQGFAYIQQAKVGRYGKNPVTHIINLRKLIAVQPYPDKGFLEDFFGVRLGSREFPDKRAQCRVIMIEEICKCRFVTFGNAQYQYYETIAGGSGAGPEFDGASVVQTHMTNSRLTDPEVLEFRFPVRLESFEIRAGSGGAGRRRGGDGGIRRIRFLEPMTASILSNGRRHGAFGMAGGEAGALGENWVERADGRRERLEHIGQAEMQPGDVMVIVTPGGGGYGAVEAVSIPK